MGNCGSFCGGSKYEVDEVEVLEKMPDEDAAYASKNSSNAPIKRDREYAEGFDYDSGDTIAEENLNRIDTAEQSFTQNNIDLI